MESDASSNVIPYLVCQKINDVPNRITKIIIQLDIFDVKVMGELKHVMIRLPFDLIFHQVIHIIVVDILESYGLLLSRESYVKLKVYFSTYWIHLWLPYKGRTNQIRVDSEAHMKHKVTELESKNKPISFSHTTLGNYFLEHDHGFYKKTSSFQAHEQS